MRRGLTLVLILLACLLASSVVMRASGATGTAGGSVGLAASASVTQTTNPYLFKKVELSVEGIYVPVKIFQQGDAPWPAGECVSIGVRLNNQPSTGDLLGHDLEILRNRAYAYLNGPSAPLIYAMVSETYDPVQRMHLIWVPLAAFQGATSAQWEACLWWPGSWWPDQPGWPPKNPPVDRVTGVLRLPGAATTTTTRPSTTTTARPTTTTTTRPTTTTSPAAAFVDVPADHPYYAAIKTIADRGIISGYEVGGGREFRPDENVARAQFTKMICGAVGLVVDEGMSSTFVDLGPDDPADLYPHQYVAAAADQDITAGVSPGAFVPWGNIARAQVVTMVVRAAEKLKPDTLRSPPAWYRGSLGDFSEIHGENMRAAEYNGLTRGLVGFGKRWDPWANATRGEVAQVLQNAIRRW